MTTGPVPVTVSAGYLGAGKTTLLNHLLRSADERVAVIVNDIGSINIDAELVESNDGSTIALTNGCLCCSLIDGLDVAFESLLEAEPRPERSVVEASGAALPASIAAHAHRPGLHLDGVLVVVDGENVLRQAHNEYIGDVIERQVRSADLLLLSKLDLVDADLRRRTEDWLGRTADAPMVEAPHGAVPLEVLVGLGARHVAEGVGDLDLHHAVTTRSESWTEPIDRDVLEAWLDALDPDVVRVKGVVRLSEAPDRRHVVHRVGRRRAIADAGPWDRERSEVVVIAVGSPR